MLQIGRSARSLITKKFVPAQRLLSSQADENISPIEEEEEFRVLNLRQTRHQMQRPQQRRFVPHKQQPTPAPRAQQMAVDQDWGAVWPGPRSFHPATVPLPLRQGYTPKGQPAPGKFANAELMKIPNFLHLTPPVIKKQCEALKQFCTPWPKGLETEEKCKEHFPIDVISSDYCHGLPTIRNRLSRIVTVRFKLSALPLNAHARDKFLRLVGDRHDPETDVLTIVTDRCPLRKQNYDYAMYLLTALLHESWVTEPWENTKSLADMEHYEWRTNKSCETVEAICKKIGKPVDAKFGVVVELLINEGENEYNLTKYKEQVLQLLNIAPLSGATS